MKKLLMILILSIIMGCGDGSEGEPCCKDHGGGGVCMPQLTTIHGGIRWANYGHIVCDGKNPDGTNYVCPGVECK